MQRDYTFVRLQTMVKVCWSLPVFLLTVAGCSTKPPTTEGRLLVAVSIHPLVSLVRNVGRDRVEILRLVPQGASPHTYEPAPSQVARLSRAEVLFLIGLGLEYWSEDLVHAVDHPGLVVVETSSSVEPIDRNPHVWLDPLNAVRLVETIRDTLVSVDPEGADLYRANARRTVDELRRLHREIAAEVGGWSQRAFVAFHPTWSYFARRYGLEETAVVEPAPGREPSVAHLSRIVEIVRRRRVRAIFAAPQLPPRLAETVAAETGADVILLDPLGGSLAPNEYLDLIRYNVETMARAMK